MKGINPIWLTVVGLFLALQTNIATGNINLHFVLPEAWIPWAVGWAKAIAAYGVTIGALLPQFSSTKAGLFISDQPVATPGARMLAFIFALGLGLLLLMPVAQAADVGSQAKATVAAPLLPVKASLGAPTTPAVSGLYFGIYTQGGGGNVQGTAVGVDPASLVTNEIGIGGAVGYAWALPKADAFMAVEGMFKVRNVNGGQPGFSFDGPVSFEERFKIGLPLEKVLSFIPNLGLPTAPPFPVLPSGTTLLNSKSYLMAGLIEDDNSNAFPGLHPFKEWKISASVGMGMIGQLSNGTALDVWLETVFPNRSTCVGPFKCANDGQKVLAGLGVWF